MATNPYSYGSLGQRWTVGEPTSKSLLDVSRVKADANRWALEQLLVDPDDTANFVLTAPGLNIDSNTLYVDSVYNSVGFGLTNPNDYAFNGTPSWVASGGAGNASVIVVSGTTSIGYLAFADGTTGTDRYSGNIQYNHNTNTMSFRTNGGVEAMTINSAQDLAVDTDTLFVDASADRVGINSTSPSTPLHVKDASTAYVMAETTGTSTSAGFRLKGDASADYTIFTTQGVGSFGIYDNANAAQRLTIDSSGNISLPTGYLQVSGNPSAGTISSNGNGQIGGLTGNGLFAYGKGSTYDLALANATTNLALAIPTGGGTTPDVYIPNSLGIGTTSPQRPLHIDGTEGVARFTSTASGNSGLEVGIGTSSQAFIWQTENSYLQFGTNNTERARITSAGLFEVTKSGSAEGLAKFESNDDVSVVLKSTYAATNGAHIYLEYEDAFASATESFKAGISGGSTNYSIGYGTIGEFVSSQNLVSVTSAGNLGLGTSSPSSNAAIHAVTTAYSGASGAIILEDKRADANPFIQVENDARAYNIQTVGARSDNFEIYDSTAAAVRLAITSDGTILVNKTSATGIPGNLTYGTVEVSQLATRNGFIVTGMASGNVAFATSSSAAHNYYAGYFYSYNGSTYTGVGNITVGTTSTSYNTTSDYRLKENVVGITDGITRIKSLKPSRFNFIADADRTVDGFVAHEVSDVVPEAISGAKDAVDEEGNPQYQGIDQSKLVPLLTAALQEAITKIETLETKVAALEAA